jgi:regulator of CtrA degradation
MLNSASVKTAFFGRTYDEAMGLLIEARNYVAVNELRRLPMLTPSDRLLLCCETMRLTTRLTHIMAWLLAQRAVHAGEITLADSAEEPYALGGAKTCLTVTEEVERLGDRWLLTLLERSHRLYIRVSRLDEMVKREALSHAEPAGSA